MYSAESIYDLVVDVASYPSFMPWCSSATVHWATSLEMQATLGIDYLGVKQQFTTRNTLDAGKRVLLKLDKGPFSSLNGDWRFIARRHDACKVEFAMDYSFSNGLLEKMVSPVFDSIASTYIDAFVKRAEAKYGAR